MNFTREPIIETILTPKDGCKLAVRNSKGVGKEEYLLDAIELVSFGATYFYRSVDRSKNFLLPASDYEVVEMKEARITLKHVVSEKNVKIGGGRDAVFRVGKEPAEEATKATKATKASKSAKQNPPKEDEEQPEEKKKETSKRRPKRRRTNRSAKSEEATLVDEGVSETQITDGEKKSATVSSEETNLSKEEQERDNREKQVLRSLLLVPPDALISERLTMMRSELEEGEEGIEPPPPPSLEEAPEITDKPEENEQETESS